MHRNFASLFLFSAIISLAPPAASAAPITVPSGLNPGDQYRLAFVTGTTRDATSTSIADYNAFVTTAANTEPMLVALGIQWRAIASTSSDAARDNTHTIPGTDPDYPIYSTGGTLLASSNLDFWDGSHAAQFSYQDGYTPSMSMDLVWTGTNLDGTISPTPLGVGSPTIGAPWDDSSAWIKYLPVSGMFPAAYTFGFYAMSGVLTVPAVPEPSAMVLACFAAAGLAVPMLRRCRNSRC